MASVHDFDMKLFGDPKKLSDLIDKKIAEVERAIKDDEWRHFWNTPVPIHCEHPGYSATIKSVETGPGIAALDLRPKPLVADEEWVSDWDLLPDAE